jgi:hypothetical protein
MEHQNNAREAGDSSGISDPSVRPNVLKGRPDPRERHQAAPQHTQYRASHHEFDRANAPGEQCDECTQQNDDRKGVRKGMRRHPSEENRENSDHRIIVKPPPKINVPTFKKNVPISVRLAESPAVVA